MKHRKRKKTRLIFLLGIILLIAGIFLMKALIELLNAHDGNLLLTHGIQNSSDDISLNEKVEQIIQNMSLEEKIGQMFIIGIKGTNIDEQSLQMLRNYHVGGIILFDRNMKSKNQVASLNKSLQENSTGNLPLFIALDEEGGIVARMRNELEAPPSQQEIGQTGKANEAKKWAIRIAKDLQNIGFNVNFAPVADVGSPDERSYSYDVFETSQFVQSAVEGYEEQKMLCSLKHFPGIGKGQLYSHIDKVIVEADLNTLWSEDIIPFKRVIESPADNYLIMISHVNYPALDTNYPASLSKNIIQNTLRDKLGFKGIVITDDLEMGAISQYYDFSKIGILVVEAGADIMLICHEYEHEKAVYDGLLFAVKSGRISEDRINESVKRIIKLKIKYLL